MLLNKTGVFQMLNKRFTPDETFHTAVKIGVSRFVTADKTTDERQEVREIEIIERAYYRILRIRELQNGHLPTGTQDGTSLSALHPNR